MSSKVLILPVFLLVFTACGGSNDDGGSESPAADAPTRITAENAVEVSASAIYTALNGDEIFSTNRLNGPFSFSNLNSYGGMEKIGVTSANALPETIDCEASGQFTVSGDFDINGGPADGLELNTVFEDCAVGLPTGGEIVFDGTLNIAITNFSGDLFSGFNLGLEIVFGEYEISSLEHRLLIDGSISTRQVLSNGTLDSEFTVNDLSVTINERSQSFIDYSLTKTINLLTSSYTIDVTGTLEDEGLGGRISLETTTPFTGTGDNNPDAGILRISGADNSVITLTALNSVDVMLDIDQGGDGSIEETIVTSWDELDATILQ